MKFCQICNISIDLPRALICRKCKKKEIHKRYLKKNKEKFELYQREYREKNRKICQLRSKISYQKKPEKYIAKRRENYRKKHGIPLDDPFVKRKNGEGYIRPEGYKVICVKGHPNSYDEHGKIHEHTYLMSKHIGRALIKGESVHHKNGLRLDNRIENLELWSRNQPPGQRVEDKIKWCIEFLIQYGYKTLKE
jgi:hypothetical protein